MAKRRQPVQRTSSFEGAVSDAMGEIQALRDEIGDWQSNLEDKNMEHLPKYDEVTECKDALDERADDEPSAPSEFPEGLEDTVTWTEPMAKRSNRATRQERLDQALAGLRAVAEKVQAFVEEHDEDPPEDSDDPDETLEEGAAREKARVWGEASRGDWETFAEECQSIVDDLEQVSFPGMY